MNILYCGWNVMLSVDWILWDKPQPTHIICRLLWFRVQRDELTDHSDRKRAVLHVPGAVSCDIGDGFLSNGEQLRRTVDWFHLQQHLKHWVKVTLQSVLETFNHPPETANQNVLFAGFLVFQPLLWSCLWRLGCSRWRELCHAARLSAQRCLQGTGALGAQYLKRNTEIIVESDTRHFNKL